MAYPAGIACLTEKQNTPLHFATKSGVVPVVKLLIKLYPKALQLRNAKGEWPIDRAIANKVDVKVITLCDR
jgi:ankyrin repeat protein